MSTFAFGWRPSLPDHRDYCVHDHLTLPAASTLPPKIDERGLWQPVLDQGQLGSCTANAVCGAIKFNEKGATHWSTRPEDSRLFQYYNSRMLEGTADQDSGASIRDAIKAAVTYGYIPETLWPYDITKFAVKPTDAMYAAALPHKISLYASVPQNAVSMKQVICAGHPIVIGFTVYQSFENVGSSGMVPMPSKRESVLGGHAVVVVGYDDSRGVWIFRNSWGASWGDQGYGYFPYQYLLNSRLSSDFWTIKGVPAVA